MPASPLRGRYLVRHPAWNAWLHTRDLLLSLTTPARRAIATTTAGEIVERVLLAVGGHLGDAVIATSLLPQIGRVFPGARVGVVTGSWNRQVFEGHPQIDAIHAFDHWKLNRSAGSLLAHWSSMRRSSDATVAAVRRIGYQVGIDLSPYYPNASEILWRAGVPVRVGYRSGGGGPRYTHALEWTAGRHVSEDHRVLLDVVRAGGADDTVPFYDLPAIPDAAVGSAERMMRAAGLADTPFVVAHTGAGATMKDWPAANWRVVAGALRDRGVRVVLTGHGAAQRVATAALSQGTGAIDLCGQLEWAEFRWLLSRANAVLSVDTVAMHVAAAQRRPCIAIMTGVDDPARWRPLGDHTTVLTDRVPCAPCYRSHGCAAMSCIRGVSTVAVLDAVAPYLPR